MIPDVSVIVPVYNRGDVVRYTFESIRRASAGLKVEVIVVDDGSAVPFAPTLERLGYTADTLIRQHNSGLLFARLAGLAASRGKFIQFLDSDDLIAPRKWHEQMAVMAQSGAVVSYTGLARTTLGGEYDALEIRPEPPPRSVTTCVDCFLKVQPAPHSPLFRRDFLSRITAAPLFPPAPEYNSVAEIWFYHIGALEQGPVAAVPQPLAIAGEHPGPRLTGHWEKLALASLRVAEDFMRACPKIAATEPARRAVGAAAFRSWRRLPRDFDPVFQRRLLAIWRDAPSSASDELGEARFAQLARLIGPETAARLWRRFRGHNYDSCRTLDDAEYRQFVAQLQP